MFFLQLLSLFFATSIFVASLIHVANFYAMGYNQEGIKKYMLDNLAKFSFIGKILFLLFSIPLVFCNMVIFVLVKKTKSTIEK